MLKLEDLLRIPGLALLTEGVKKEEVAFSCEVFSMEDSQVVEVVVRCPKIRDLILFKKATVYRPDGGALPTGWGALEIEQTLEVMVSISRSEQVETEAEAAIGVGVDPFREQIRSVIHSYLEKNPGPPLDHLPVFLEAVSLEYLLQSNIKPNP